MASFQGGGATQGPQNDRHVTLIVGVPGLVGVSLACNRQKLLPARLAPMVGRLWQLRPVAGERQETNARATTSTSDRVCHLKAVAASGTVLPLRPAAYDLPDAAVVKASPTQRAPPIPAGLHTGTPSHAEPQGHTRPTSVQGFHSLLDTACDRIPESVYGQLSELWATIHNLVCAAARVPVRVGQSPLSPAAASSPGNSVPSTPLLPRYSSARSRPCPRGSSWSTTKSPTNCCVALKCWVWHALDNAAGEEGVAECTGGASHAPKGGGEGSRARDSLD